jgi:fructose-1,6-bisphosphatase/sedoheptulose 1,7-bisphosphatase-like protein
MRVLDPPRNYGEAVAQYNKLREEFPHWLAGKDSYAYQVLGWEELDIFQNVDFYYGELIEHKTHYQQLKQVPDFEMWRRLEELERRVEKIEVLTEERDRHIKKLKEVKRLGW